MNDLEELVCSIRERYIAMFAEHWARSDKTIMRTPDFVIFGLVNRNIALVEAMPALIESKNIHALAPLLRVQLDGLLRLHAFRLLTSMDDLAMRVIRGEELRSFRDRNGKKLYDRYLVDSLKAQYLWVESMYDKLCSWCTCRIVIFSWQPGTDRRTEQCRSVYEANARQCLINCSAKE